MSTTTSFAPCAIPALAAAHTVSESAPRPSHWPFFPSMFHPMWHSDSSLCASHFHISTMRSDAGIPRNTVRSREIPVAARYPQAFRWHRSATNAHPPNCPPPPLPLIPPTPPPANPPPSQRGPCHVAQDLQSPCPQNHFKVGRPAGILEGNHFVVEFLPLRAKAVRAGNHHVNFLSTGINGAANFRDAFLQWRKARRKTS